MKDITITKDIIYVGVDDKTIDLFESQYVVPNGVSYNSYLIMDEKVTLMDTVDARATDEWLANLDKALAGKKVDYLVVSHMEPDHAGNIKVLAEKYPDMQVVVNTKALAMIPQFFDLDISDRAVVVKEGDTLNLGKHTLQFFMAPMVHWPEVMVAYEQSEKILFSADGFGKFGALDTDEAWTCEARRYYFNIVGKYGAQVQALLKKAATLDIQMICPLHGPILKEDLGYYIGKYDIWSRYEPEEKGVLIVYASMYGNTEAAAQQLASTLCEKGMTNVAVYDVSNTHVSYLVAEAFKYSHIVLASVTYNLNIYPVMYDFLHHLKGLNFQKRTFGIIENGSWAIKSGGLMKNYIEEELKECMVLGSQVSINSSANESNGPEFVSLADALIESMK